MSVRDGGRDLDSRRRNYAELGTALAKTDDRSLIARLSRVKKATAWGLSESLRLGNGRVFVKRIPITERELANGHSTRNLFQLPTFYNYGVGSTGFGAFRELLGHDKTTRWVLEGRTESFPILLHHRIARVRRRVDPNEAAALDRHVAYWNGSRRVRRFMQARAAAPAELLLFLEHIPHTVASWSMRRPAALPWAVGELRRTIELLREERMIHFDVHDQNALTDGERVYLTDFGLLLDHDFALTDRERAFFAANRRYDEGRLLYSVGADLARRFRRTSASKQRRLATRYGFDPASRHEALCGLLASVGDLVGREELKLDPGYVQLIERSRPVIELMSEFFERMMRGPNKRVTLDHAGLVRALAASA